MEIFSNRVEEYADSMDQNRRFEDVIAWQKARVLVKDVYTKFGNHTDFGFRDQICRASVSVMNNIAEGYEKRTDADFRKFLYIAKGSCGEVRSMLYIALDLEYINQQEFKSLFSLSEEISRILGGFIKKLNR